MKRGGRLKAKHDPKWERTRKQAHDRAKGFCEKCGKLAPLKGEGYVPHGQGHHVKPRSTHPELRYDVDNVQWLCGGMYGCHETLERAKEHGLCSRKPVKQEGA